MYFLDTIDDREMRNYLIIKICYYNPLIAVKTSSSICEDTTVLDNQLFRIIKGGIKQSTKPDKSCSVQKIALFLEALAELEQYQFFVDYYSRLRFIWTDIHKTKKDFKSLNVKLFNYLNFDQYLNLYKLFAKNGDDLFISLSIDNFLKLYDNSISETNSLRSLAKVLQSCYMYRFANKILQESDLFGTEEQTHTADSVLGRFADKQWGVMHVMKLELGYTMYEIDNAPTELLREYMLRHEIPERELIAFELKKMCRWGLFSYEKHNEILSGIDYLWSASRSAVFDNPPNRLEPEKIKRDIERLRSKDYNWYSENDLFYDFPYQYNLAKTFIDSARTNYAFRYSLDFIPNSRKQETGKKITEFFCRVFEEYSTAEEILYVFLNSPLHYVFSLEQLLEIMFCKLEFNEKDINSSLLSYKFRCRIKMYDDNKTFIANLLNVINFSPLYVNVDLNRNVEECVDLQDLFCQIQYNSVIPKMFVIKILQAEEGMICNVDRD